MDELKTWQTHSVKHKVAALLMTDGIPFSFDEETGISFTAPEFYVERLKERLVNCYGCSLKPIFNELK
ncbi:MAG: hypothetical protein J1E16_00430 [Muribaculaceae bacterium]|nr:hypothetical protein [Muribaculaceae bacterium]